jgi:hypothetical protein
LQVYLQQGKINTENIKKDKEEVFNPIVLATGLKTNDKASVNPLHLQ